MIHSRPMGRRFLALAACFAAFCLQGCGSDYPLLASEDDHPTLSELKSQGRDRPIERLDAVVTPSTAAPSRVSLHVSQEPQPKRSIVLIHGVFTDHRAWRFLVGPLAEHGQVIMPDLPGCGTSAAAPHGESGYAPSALADRLLAALEASSLISHEGPIAIVGHSFGGLVAIRMFADADVRGAHADLLDRVDRLVLISPVDIAVEKPHPFFAELAYVSPWRLATASITGWLRRAVVRGTLQSVSDPALALREEADIRFDVLTDPIRRFALQSMLRQAIPFVYDRPDWPVIERLEEGYAHVDPPCLILWGTRDETLPISMGYKLAAQFPHAAIEPVPFAKHSPHLEAPDVVAQRITTFLREGLGDQ